MYGLKIGEIFEENMTHTPPLQIVKINCCGVTCFTKEGVNQEPDVEEDTCAYTQR